MEQSKIRVFSSAGKAFQRVEVNDVPIPGVRSVTYSADPDSVPIIELEVMTLMDEGWTDLFCNDIRISYTPKTEAEAMKILGIIGKYEGSDGYPVYVVDKEDEF